MLIAALSWHTENMTAGQFGEEILTMKFVGIEAVTYGVTHLPKACKFWTDFGLKEVNRTSSAVEFMVADGARVIVRRYRDQTLPPAVEGGSSVREITWGLESAAALDTLRDRLAANGQLLNENGVRAVDPAGFALAFDVSTTTLPDLPPSPTNAPQDINRVDTRACFYDRAMPIKIGHIVLNTPDVKASRAFYEEILGFHVSDEYDNGSVFLRCAARHSHHNLFLLQSPNGKPAINHLAFAVRDIHEMFAGGQHMSTCGWKTAVGPGRHVISSCYFWYVQNPCGGLAEYFWDEDFLTEEWKPQMWKPGPKVFAEWMLPRGLPQR